MMSGNALSENREILSEREKLLSESSAAVSDREEDTLCGREKQQRRREERQRGRRNWLFRIEKRRREEKKRPGLLGKWSAVLPGILLCVTVLNLGVSAAHRSLLQRGIAEEVLRFHVLANSDSEEDQRIKLLVRDAVLEWMSAELNSGPEAGQEEKRPEEKQPEEKQAEEKQPEEKQQEEKQSEGVSISGTAGEKDSGEPTEDKEYDRRAERESSGPVSSGKESELQFLSGHLREIEQIADRVLEAEGVSYEARASIENCYFPARTYGECTFPAGWYDALRVCLGEAQGQNWWCVLYPALCFSDCLHAVVDGEALVGLKEVLTVEEYECLLREPKEWKLAFRWF